MRMTLPERFEQLEASGVMDARREALSGWFTAHPGAVYWEAVAALGYPDYMLGVADSILVDLKRAARNRQVAVRDETCRRTRAAAVRGYLAWLPGKPGRRQKRGPGPEGHVSSQCSRPGAAPASGRAGCGRRWREQSCPRDR